jgi:hypothetical protein
MESFAKSASYFLDATVPASIRPDAVFYDWGTGVDHRGGVDTLKSSRQCGGDFGTHDKPLRKQPWIKRPFR